MLFLLPSDAFKQSSTRHIHLHTFIKYTHKSKLWKKKLLAGVLLQNGN